MSRARLIVNPSSGTDQAAHRVALRRARDPSDVGVLNGRAFVNTSGGGFISEVTEALDDSMTMTFARPVKVNTDGELLEAAVCRYGVMPRAARFLAGTSNS